PAGDEGDGRTWRAPSVGGRAAPRRVDASRRRRDRGRERGHAGRARTSRPALAGPLRRPIGRSPIRWRAARVRPARHRHRGVVVKVLWKVGAIAMVAMVLSSCAYLERTTQAQQAGGAKPWWCNPTEEIPVTQGPAVGSVDYYAGTHKAPLNWDQCKAL